MTDTTQLARPPAAWYPDNADARILRWWDGQQWTAHTVPAQAQAQAHAQAQPSQAAPSATVATSRDVPIYVPSRDPVAYAYSNPVMNPGVNSMATRAMIYSLIGLVINPLGIMSIGGLVLGIRALRRSSQFAPESARRGFAIAAIAVAAASIVLLSLAVVAAINVYGSAHRSY